MQVRVDSHVADALDRLEMAIGRGLEACGLKAEAYARELVPKDTGNLRDHITSQVEEHDCYIGVSTMSPPYSIYVEFGTGKYSQHGGRQTPWVYKDAKGGWHTTEGQKPQPFIRPAVENHTGEYRQILEDSLRNA